MGLFDQITGSLGGNSGSIDYVAIIKWVEQQGGVAGLLEKLRQGGLSEIVQSWLSTGPNLPISENQIENIFSSEAIGQLAGKLGIDQNKATTVIAQFLPQVIDKLSPEGKEPESNDLVSMGIGLLKDRFFK